MKKKLRVAVLANIKANAPRWEGMPKDRWADLDSEKTVNALVEAVRAGGYESEFLEGDVTFLDNIRKYNPDICFNICEGHYGDSREAQVPAMLEMLRIPYTGSRVLSLALALDKPMTKRILHFHELPTPAFQVFERTDETLQDDLNFPLFVKPSSEGTGMGVSAKSVVQNETELREQVDFIIRKYRQTALVEDFIDGRELTLGMVGNLEGPVAQRLPDDLDSPRIQAGLRFLPPMEVDLKPYLESDAVYSNRLKSEIPEELTYLCPAPLTQEQLEDLNWLAAAVFRVMDAKDVSRIDFRLDMHDNWKPYILEINPLPGLSPGISDIVIEAAAEGIGHTELVHMILDAALKRYGKTP
jgi:D-alanine-D-alanine ligase